MENISSVVMKKSEKIFSPIPEVSEYKKLAI